MGHKDFIVIQKMLSEIRFAEEFVEHVSIAEFLKDEKIKRAVCMTAINIGELAKSISPELRRDNPQVPWKKATGLRDVAAHKYQTLIMEDVYATVTEDFPSLANELTKILEKEKS